MRPVSTIKPQFWQLLFEKAYSDRPRPDQDPDPDPRSPPRRGGRRGGGQKFYLSRGGAGRELEKNSEIGVGRGGNWKKIKKSGWGGAGTWKKIENRGGAGREPEKKSEIGVGDTIKSYIGENYR